MESLKSVLERRAVFFDEHVSANLDSVVRAHSHEPVVKSSMMDLAHGDAICDDGLAPLCVAANMGGVEKRAMAKAAKRAAILVGRENLFTEYGLMQALPDNAICVRPPEVDHACIVSSSPGISLLLVECDHELEIDRLFVDEPDGSNR